jgi:glutathione S-transferase
MAGALLHYVPGACSRVTHVALEEIGEPFELHLVKRAAGEHQSAEYRAVNPKGKVPTLEIDGRVITENPAVQTYLHRRFSAVGLLPDEQSDDGLEALTLMCWFASGIHPLIPRMRKPGQFCDAPGSEQRVREIAARGAHEAFAMLEERIGDGPWLFADWTIVDMYLNWLWFRANDSGLDGSPYPGLAEHSDRLAERPSVARALATEEQALQWLADNGYAEPVPDRNRPLLGVA